MAELKQTFEQLLLHHPVLNTNQDPTTQFDEYGEPEIELTLTASSSPDAPAYEAATEVNGESDLRAAPGCAPSARSDSMSDLPLMGLMAPPPPPMSAPDPCDHLGAATTNWVDAAAGGPGRRTTTPTPFGESQWVPPRVAFVEVSWLLLDRPTRWDKMSQFSVAGLMEKLFIGSV